jgi:cell fate regulator YaaT (PSP1 superfamily)
MHAERIAMPEQTVVAVKLRYNPKDYWFDPALSTYETGDHVLVDTERGREIGLVTNPAITVTDEQIKALKTPLKPVIRALSEADYDRIDELDAKGRAAMPTFRELIEKHKLEMKPVSVEYLFSGDKAVFYFSNDERVDFRELVRDLASHFHIRVDMRQIGVRDEARILGGLAHCGEELCCARLGGEFQPVSIRMAKEQDLPLNPAKISGACGRLMCCLRYEFEAYKDFKNRAPKKGAIIETPLGKAKVIDFDTPREIITMRLEDGKQLAIPLAEFDPPEEGAASKRPCCVGRDAVDRCASSSILMALNALEQELSAANVVTTSSRDKDSEQPQRRPRRTNNRQGEKQGRKQGDGARASRASDRALETAEDKSGNNPPQKKDSRKQKPRPGQNSSGLRAQTRSNERPTNRPARSLGESTRPTAEGSSENRSSDGRRRRRRRPDKPNPS